MRINKLGGVQCPRSKARRNERYCLYSYTRCSHFFANEFKPCFISFLFHAADFEGMTDKFNTLSTTTHQATAAYNDDPLTPPVGGAEGG